MNLGSKVGQKLVVVRKTKMLGERGHKALFPSEGKGPDDDDDDILLKNKQTQNLCCIYLDIQFVCCAN